MAFIQGVRPDNVNTRDSEHIPTKIYKKGRTFFKAVGSFAAGSVKFVTPLLDILSSSGVFFAKGSSKSHIKKGITLSCTVLKLPKLIGKTVMKAPQILKKKGVELTENLINTASNVTSIALGIMTCFKLGDTIVSLCSAISSSMGTGFTVIGKGISTALPFIGVFSAIEIVKSLLDVGKESVKLYKTAKKISATTEKMNIWTEMDWNDPAYISSKLDRMKVKQIKTVKGLEKLEGALATSVTALNSRVLRVDKRWAKLEARKLKLKDENAVSRLFGQMIPQLKLTMAIVKKEAAEKKHLSALQSFNKISAKHTMRAIKIRNFSIIEGKIKANTLNERDLAVLNYFKTNKVETLKTKKSNLKVEAIGHGITIGLKALVVITMVASLALTLSGIGTGPGVITNASVVLFVMAAEYGLKKFKEFSPPKEWIPVKVPALLEGPDEKIERKAKALLAHRYHDQIKVDVNNGNVTLNGTVIDLTERESIEEKLKSIDDIAEIDNQITKQEPI